MKRLAAVALVLLTACAGSPNQRPKVRAHPTTTASPSPPSPSTTSMTVATTTTISVAPTATSLVLARACGADDLGIESTRTEGAGGHTGLFLQLMNVSSTTCSLSGYPGAVNATTPDGQPLTTVTKGVYFPEPLPGNLEPRAGNGSLIVETTQSCKDAPDNPPAKYYRDIAITVPGGGRLSLGAITIEGACGVWVSQLGVEPQQ